MAPPRTFDYDLLKELVRQHPDWSYHQYAQVLTRDMRNKTGDPGYPMVLSNAVAAAISRYKDRWAEQGLIITDQRVPVYKELIPERWRVTETERMATELRHLRTIAPAPPGRWRIWQGSPSGPSVRAKATGQP